MSSLTSHMESVHSKDSSAKEQTGYRVERILSSITLEYAGKECGKALSEDFFDAARPDATELNARGMVFAIADGVSGGGGRRAAETCVFSALADYYAAPAAWTAAQSLDRVFGALNAWLLAQNQRLDPQHSMLSTLTVLVLRGNEFHIAHVGDCRVYRVRGRALECLTTDHVWPRRDMRGVLRRAVGLDQHLVVDCVSDQLLPDDRFVLLTDGVWEVLGESVLREVLVESGACAAAAHALVERSITKQRAYYGRNDATAAVVHVTGLPLRA